MVEQHPHILKFSTGNTVTEPYQNNDGDWVIPEAGETENTEIKCRAQENSKDAKVVGVDGTKLEFAFMVFMPVDSPEILEGTTIEITNEGKSFFNGDVKRFFRGQLNSRLWV
jgi:hypothetical protein